MSKKVNITKDLESRRRIARTRPFTNANPQATQDETHESKAGPSPQSSKSEYTVRSDKKSGRKATGNP